MIDPVFLRQLDQFKLAMKKKTSSIYKGSEQSRETGRGLTFKDFREYSPGDDIRYIDWKVYAREEKFYIKTFEEERDMTIHIILDASQSMDFGDPLKYEYAAKLGLGVAYLACKNNQKFEFSIFSDKFEALESTQAILRIIDRINSKKPKGQTNIGDTLADYNKRIKSKSLIIIISDFLFDIQNLENVLLNLKRNDMMLIQVLDEKERQLAYSGDSILKDSETQVLLHTYISQRLKSKYADELQTHIKRIENTCRKLNVGFLTTTNNVPFFESFFEVFKML